ncbi:hypothetical protein [Polynucleobacter sp. UB-Tiil-W10]|uniref:hypothetical protein n=1 Tax=Polynucleobacter sp. UB-Tiil-W10 TaxID=1855648 RepID=UPI001C0D33F0|nr:hypothetical protein [Polynucleobacter sp. UB-Tiil-W10]
MEIMDLPALSDTTTTVSLTFVLMDIFFGVTGLILILIFHGSGLNHMAMRFERITKVNLERNQYDWVFFHFYVAFIIIALIHICEIFIWAAMLFWFNLIPSGVNAILFAGSCYTTVGFISDILPYGWKTVPFFIAFSGLFSIAWTTSTMIGMTGIYRQAWNLKYLGRYK